MNRLSTDDLSRLSTGAKAISSFRTDCNPCFECSLESLLYRLYEFTKHIIMCYPRHRGPCLVTTLGPLPGDTSRRVDPARVPQLHVRAPDREPHRHPRAVSRRARRAVGRTPLRNIPRVDVTRMRMTLVPFRVGRSRAVLKYTRH